MSLSYDYVETSSAPKKSFYVGKWYQCDAFGRTATHYGKSLAEAEMILSHITFTESKFKWQLRGYLPTEGKWFVDNTGATLYPDDDKVSHTVFGKEGAGKKYLTVWIESSPVHFVKKS